MRRDIAHEMKPIRFSKHALGYTAKRGFTVAEVEEAIRTGKWGAAELRRLDGQRFSDPRAHFGQCRLFVRCKIEVRETVRISPPSAFYTFWIRNHLGNRKRVFCLNAHFIFWRELGANLSAI